LELRILVKLLTQQSTTPSTTREEIEEDPFVLALGFGHGLVERALEPILGRSEGSNEENERDEGECFLHGHLRKPYYRAEGGMSTPFNLIWDLYFYGGLVQNRKRGDEQ
jgi:hypothetical protein